MRVKSNCAAQETVIDASRKPKSEELLAVATRMLEDGEREVEDGVGEIEDGVGEIEDGVGEIGDGVGEIGDGVGEVEDGMGEVEDWAGEVEDEKHVCGDVQAGSGVAPHGLLLVHKSVQLSVFAWHAAKRVVFGQRCVQVSCSVLSLTKSAALHCRKANHSGDGTFRIPIAAADLSAAREVAKFGFTQNANEST